MKIIFCHHAQREKNQNNSNPQNDGITTLGKKDAEIFSEMLNFYNAKINAIYTSPFIRCKITAELINKNQNAPILVEPRFNEFGSLENESWLDCQNRIIEAINDITDKHSNDDVILCVTSGVNFTVFICWAYKIKPSKKHPFPGIISCSPIIFNYNKKTVPIINEN